MANILPVSDLRNYNEVLKNCRTGEPVFLTKNGRGGRGGSQKRRRLA